MTVKPALATRLTKEAVRLNKVVGDPTRIVKAKDKKGGVRKSRSGYA